MSLLDSFCTLDGIHLLNLSQTFLWPLHLSISVVCTASDLFRRLLDCWLLSSLPAAFNPHHVAECPHPPPHHRRLWQTSRLTAAPRMTCSSTFSPSPSPPPTPRSTWVSTVEPSMTNHSPSPSASPSKPPEAPHSLILLPSQHGRDVPSVGA
jgi:hypothetical protein